MKQQSIHRMGRLAIVLSSVGILATISGCTTARIPATSLEVPLIDIPLPAVLRGQNDLRSRSWSKAFLILHERMKREYAYSSVKQMDWDALYAQFSADVLAAEEAGDRNAWYRALRGYLYAIPDGNVQIDPNEELRVLEEGAAVGLSLAQLADGSVMVSGLVPGGPAETAGIEFGALVTSWNEQPIVEALEATSLFWADTPAATPATRRAQQLIWLPRGAAGDIARLVFTNPGAATESTVTLVAEIDDYATLPLYRPLWSELELFSSPVSGRTLGDGIYYVRLAAVAPTFSSPFPQREFRAAIRKAIDTESRGLILDLRGSQGGDAGLAPKLLGSFVETPSFYEVPGIWNSETETFAADPDSTLIVEPQLPAFTGPVMILVDGYTMGPAESIVRFLQARENVRVCGITGTYGSPGAPGAGLTLPGSYMIFYPDQQSLDEAGAPQGVANRAGEGNVIPDVTVALDALSAAAIYRDREDRVLETALEVLGN